MTESNVLFENANIVESGENSVTYLEGGTYSHVIYTDDTAFIGDGDTIELAKQQAKELFDAA